MDIYFVEFDFSKLKKTEISILHHKISRQILKKILDRFYNINAEILEFQKKPYIENNPVYFSISHSNSLFCYAISDEIVGIDIEFIKKRNFASILKYMNIDLQNATEDNFYRFWTSYEANFKSKLNNNLSFKYGNYFGSISSEKFSDIKAYILCFDSHSNLNFIRSDKISLDFI